MIFERTLEVSKNMAGNMPVCRMAGRVIEGYLDDINSKIRQANEACKKEDEESWRSSMDEVLRLTDIALSDVWKRFGKKGYVSDQVVRLRMSRKETKRCLTA